MNRPQLLELHDELCSRAKAIMEAKNHDYAGADGESPFANFEAVQHLGIIERKKGLLIRMLDKYQRIKTFCETGKLMVPGEGFEDAILDLINYEILFAGMAREDMEAAEDDQPDCPDGDYKLGEK